MRRIPKPWRGAGLWALTALAAAYAAAGGGKAADPADLEFFEKKVRPILAEHCYQCHSEKAKSPKGGLRVDGRDFLLKGGDSGPAVVPGRPEKSRLVEAVSYRNTELQMPPRGKLPDAALADLREWVQRGAPWPEEGGTGTAAPRDGIDVARRMREHWAWRPVRAPAPPAVKDRGWVRDPADAFLLATLEAKGLRPAPAADRRTWLRRVTFDLTGLPPTSEEIDAFLADGAPGAEAKVVDRLLASPHFGERWARHWLDLVRYADSRGHEFDPIIPNAYQYRDYVIRAFNADVPYNQFVTEHLAGDLLDRPRLHPEEGFNESVLGTGFWLLGEEVHSPVDIRQDQADRFDNRLDVMTKTFLGLTVACARCHDHKFDPITQKDYYALFGFLSSSGYRQVRFDSLGPNRAAAVALAKLRAKARKEISKALAESAKLTTDRLADYLLAAREAIPKGPRTSGAVPPQPVLADLAADRKLDGDRLASWAAVLLDADRDPSSPLHAWARVCADPKANDPKRIAELLQPLVEEMRRREDAARAALKDAQVVIDYARCGPDQWMQDEAAFGPAPARPGDVRITGEAASPAVRFVERGAAEYDRAFDVLRLAPGTENDPGALGKVTPRAGRTLRTPTFKVTTGKVYYLVRGAGAAYAAVSAHAVIDGPLHGQLVQNLPARGEFRWHAQDLTRYRGLDAHIEFTAEPGSDFAVAMVVQAETTPGSVDRPVRALLKLLGEAKSLEALAAGYGRLFAEAAKRLAAEDLGTPEEATDTARLANWLVNHPELLGDGVKRFTGAAAGLLAKEKEAGAGIKAESRLAPALLDGDGVDEHVFVRGSPRTEGEPAPRRLLEALVGPRPLAPPRGSGRLELARQITAPDVNPFVARVLVNRVWHHLFGRGLVASVDNFGVMGEPPTHPELLDFLAARFVREGWSVKKLIRELTLSSAYRMASQPSPEADQADPDNRLLHRMRLRRLEGEAIRDAMLAVSGRLDRTLYGPPVPIYLTPFLDGRGRPGSGPLDGNGRRSLYLAVKRNFLSPMLLAFDTPAPFSTVGRRSVSNVPAQALILMNDPFVHDQAAQWAKKILAKPGTMPQRVTEMYLSAFGRPPTEEELRACEAFLDRQAKQHGANADDPQVWADLAHTLFNVKEFIYLN
jgi:hypothetical protein